MQIYINKDGQQYGPYTLEQLQQYVQEGHFTAQDYACHDGQNWITVGQVPGFAGGGQTAAAQSQAQAAQQQAQQAARQPAAAQARATAQPQQAAAAVTVDTASKKKKIILWSSIGVAATLAVAGIVILMSGDDEAEDKELAAKTGDKPTGTAPVDPNPSDPAPNNPDPDNSSSNNSNTLLGHELPFVPLIERIPDNALGLATLSLDKVIQKGGTKLASMLPPDVPPFIRSALKDPASIGLDVSEPARAYLLAHPTKPDEDPTIAFVAKLSDSAKLKQLLQSIDAPPPTATKDGYDMWDIDSGEAYLAVADGFLFFVMNEDRRARGHQSLLQELERFMTTDGSNSLVEAHPAILDQESKGYDLGVWVNLEKVGSLAEGEAPDELLGLVEAGSLSGGLRFDKGEVLLEFNGASKGLGKAFGGGGISSELANFLGSDAAMLASISMSLDGLVGFFEDTLADQVEETGLVVTDLDKPIPEFGIAPREVLDVFQGGFALSMYQFPGGETATENKISPSGIQEEQSGSTAPDPFSPGGEFGDKGDSGIDHNPFGGPPAKPNPFGGNTAPGKPEIAIDPPAGGNPFDGSRPGGFGEGPPGGPPNGGFGGPPPGGPGGLPKEFDMVLAASIDDAKWNAVMQKSPQLAGILGMGALIGITVKAENGVLAVSTPQRAAAVAGGGLPNAVSGSDKSLFTGHDFAIKINPSSMPESMKQSFRSEFGPLLKDIDSLTVTADARSDGGGLAVRLGLTDKRSNSLPALIDMGMKFVMYEESHRPTEIHPDHDHGHDERATEDFERF